MDRTTPVRRTLVLGIIIFAVACVLIWVLDVVFTSINWVNPRYPFWISLAMLIQFLSYAIPTITGVLIAAWIVLIAWKRAERRDRG